MPNCTYGSRSDNPCPNEAVYLVVNGGSRAVELDVVETFWCERHFVRTSIPGPETDRGDGRGVRRTLIETGEEVYGYQRGEPLS